MNENLESKVAPWWLYFGLGVGFRTRDQGRVLSHISTKESKSGMTKSKTRIQMQKSLFIVVCFSPQSWRSMIVIHHLYDCYSPFVFPLTYTIIHMKLERRYAYTCPIIPLSSFIKNYHSCLWYLVVMRCQITMMEITIISQDTPPRQKWYLKDSITIPNCYIVHNHMIIHTNISIQYSNFYHFYLK